MKYEKLFPVLLMIFDVHAAIAYTVSGTVLG